MVNLTEQVDFSEQNDRALQVLKRSLARSQGRFTLLIVRCNYVSLRDAMLQRLQEELQVKFDKFVLPKGTEKLHETILRRYAYQKPQALMVCGMEVVENLDALVSSTKPDRDRFEEDFPYPMVLWVTDEVQRKLVRLGADFYNWATFPPEFGIDREALLKLLREKARETFASYGNDSLARHELAAIEKDLREFGEALDPELKGCLAFIRGSLLRGDMDGSISSLRSSLAVWEELDNLERQGAVCALLTDRYKKKARRDRKNQLAYWQTARELWEVVLARFETAEKEDLLARYLRELGDLLRRLQEWRSLEMRANLGLALHRKRGERREEARDLGFLAEVALGESRWQAAQGFAEEAIALENHSFQQEGWLYFLLGRAQKELGEVEEAIANWHRARKLCEVAIEPSLSIAILDALRSLYFQQRDYLTAFRLKLEQRKMESEYGFRAFIGAGRLQPPKEAIQWMTDSNGDAEEILEEILAASGRKPNLKDLLDRIESNHAQLTVIYGQSGVGKSSLVEAGLVPALGLVYPEGREIVPVLVQVYGNWVSECGKQLTLQLRKKGFEGHLESCETILNQLHLMDRFGFAGVLIFDQFEEFFFACKDRQSRQEFYQFLHSALQITYVKVIVSLREDYLHYLLECCRTMGLSIINNDILNKDNLVYVGNFSRKDAREIIGSLTARSQVDLSSDLINAMVADLAAEWDEVRPIELQLVGMQLQEMGISSVEEYREIGDRIKERLVEQFLANAVSDCGAGNEDITKLILYLLTDENNTRPLKTQDDLELELEVGTERLNLILEILVRSGLVLRIPLVPEDCYQLVHDYLVLFVRKQQSQRLIQELEKEREERRLTEAKLNKVLREQLEETQRSLLWKVGLGTIAGALAMIIPLISISLNNTSLDSMTEKASRLLGSNDDLEALVKNLKTSKHLKKWSWGVKQETKLKVLASLQDNIYTIREKNSLEGHKSGVTHIAVSPDAKKIASVDEDNNINIWDFKGNNMISFEDTRHTEKITNIVFSPDNKIIVSGSMDKTLKSWDADTGKEIKNFVGHKGSITSITFTSDSKNIISGDSDNNLILWDLNGNQKGASTKHKDTVSKIGFIPEQNQIISLDDDKELRVWSKNMEEINVFDLSVYSERLSVYNSRLSSVSYLFPFTEQNPFLLVERLFFTSGLHGRNLEGISRNSKFYLFDRKMNLKEVLKHNQNREEKFSFQIRNILKKFPSILVQGVSSVKGHKNNTTDLHFLPETNLVISGSHDKTIKIWDITDRDFNSLQNNHLINSISFNSKNQLIASNIQRYPITIWQKNGDFLMNLLGSHLVSRFSPNNENSLVSASRDYYQQLWTKNGRFHLVIDFFRVSPDYKKIALVKDKNIVRIWDTQTNDFLDTKNLNESVKDLLFSPNSATLAIIYEDNNIDLWNIKENIVSSLKIENMQNIVFNPNGTILAVTNKNGDILLCDRDGSQCRLIEGNGKPIQEISFSSDGDKIIILDGENTIQFLQKDGKVINSFTSSWPMKIDFSPNKEIIAVQGHGNLNKLPTIEIWKSDGTFRSKLSLEDERETDLLEFIGFTSDSKFLVSETENQIMFWNQKGKLVSSFFNGRVSAYSDNFQYFATIEGKRNIKIWDRNKIILSDIYIKTKKADLKDIELFQPKIIFSPNGKILAIQTNSKTIEIWKVDGTYLGILAGIPNKEIQRYKNFNYYGFKNTIPMKFLDNNFFALRTDENRVKIWDIKNKTSKEILSKTKNISTEPRHINLISNIYNIPNSNFFTVGGYNDVVKLWELEPELKKAEILQNFQGHENEITDISISIDGKIASSSIDRTVKIWNKNGNLIRNFKRHDDIVNSVKFSPDGQVIASGSDDKTVKLWKPDNGTVIQSFEEHGNGVTDISFSPDGKLIASASKDNTVKLWTPENGKVLANFPHNHPVLSVDFHPTQKLIATATDKNIKLWNYDGVLIKEYQRLGSHDVKFTPDGKSIAAGGNEYIPIWDFDLDRLIEKGCNWARDYLKNNINVEKRDRRVCDGIGEE